MTITILGAGKMGQSFARSFLKYDLIKAENLHLITRSRAQAEALKQEFLQSRITSFDEKEKITSRLIILAVKPQDFQNLSEQLMWRPMENQIIVSLMAGVRTKQITERFSHRKIIRAMPNSPSILGMGMTAYTATKEVSISELMEIERLLNSTGRAVYFEDEKLMDAVTALSGSGPAYFYYIVQAMVQAGKKMGLAENLSKLLVQQTVLGAYHMVNTTDKSLEDLIADVASKGGTTEAALKFFKENRFAEILQEGILAAQKRSEELSREDLKS